MADDNDPRPSGVQKFARAAGDVAKATVGVDPSAWFRAFFVQVGAAGVVCLMIYQWGNRLWDRMEAQDERFDAAQHASADARVRQWDHVRAVKDELQRLREEIQELRRDLKK